MAESALAVRVKALIIVRAFFVSLLLGSAYLFAVQFLNIVHPYAISTFIIVLYVLTIIYSVFLRYMRIRNLTAFVYIQLFIDIFAELILVGLTGGVESPFSFLFILTVLSASIIINRKAGHSIAGISSVLYGLLMMVQYYRLLPIGYDIAYSSQQFIYFIIIHAASFFLTAFLSGHLASRLEKTVEKLQEQDLHLKDLEYFNTKIIESLPSGLFTTDEAGTVIMFNRSAENITGVPKHDAIGRLINSILPFIIIPLRNERFESSFTSPAGEQKTIGITISSLVDSFGRSTGFIGIFQDLTDLKLLENEMKRKEQLAAIGALSANIAHEIRNPLAALKGSIEMLRDESIPQKHRDHLMGIAIGEMERLNSIITEFLTYSRPRPLEIRTFDLSSLLRDTLSLIENDPSTKGQVTIESAIPDNVIITADPLKLRQVFWNLGMNAIEAMHEGGKLQVSVIQNNRSVRITFADNGKGIPPVDIKNIFFPFFTTKQEGTGLGLAIAYRIIEEHQGSISVSSTPGIGTSFDIILNSNGPER